MIWLLLAAGLVVIALAYEVNRLTAEILMLQNRLAMSEHYRRQDARTHAAEIERERALTKAAIDELSDSPLFDMELCEAEMDRLEVEDLLEELDEGFPN